MKVTLSINEKIWKKFKKKCFKEEIKYSKKVEELIKNEV